MSKAIACQQQRKDCWFCWYKQGNLGYNLPVYYGKGIMKEHEHCRTNASLFDVSHMGQLIITGPDRIKLLQLTTVGTTDSIYWYMKEN